MSALRADATALMVALSVVRKGAANGLATATRAAAEVALRAAGGGWPWLARLAGCGSGRRMLDLVEACCLPGLARHHCERKRWLQQRLALPAASRRWLWIGPGCDLQPRQLAAGQPGIELLELERPPTLDLRMRMLATLASAPAPAGLLPLSLPEDAPRLLALAALAPASVIAEGVPMYLPGRACLRLLRQLAALPRPPRLLFSLLLPCAADGGGFRDDGWLLRRWLRAHDAPFRWRLGEPALVRLLRRHGYRIDALWRGGMGELMVDTVCVAARARDG